MRSDVDLSFLDEELSFKTDRSPDQVEYGVVPNFGHLQGKPQSPVPMLGFLTSGLFHLAWISAFMFLISPFGRGKRTSIALELGFSQPSELVLPSVIEPVATPPLLLEAPESNSNDQDAANEVEESISDEKAENAAGEDGADASQSEDANNDAGNDESSSDGHLAATAGQTGQFFGTQALGDRFVYVIDMSSSMRGTAQGSNKTRLKVAQEEVVRSIQNLTPDQEFYVILFAAETRPMFDRPIPKMIPATAENKIQLARWLLNVPNSSGTDPRAALRTGLRLNPSSVFLLSDGQFNGQRNQRNLQGLSGNPSVEEIVEQNRRGDIPIHTIALDYDGESRMQTLAQSTGGTYRYVRSASSLNLPASMAQVRAPGNFGPLIQENLVKSNTRARSGSMTRRAELAMPTQRPSRNADSELLELLARKALVEAASTWKKGDRSLARKQLQALIRAYPGTRSARTALKQLKK